VPKQVLPTLRDFQLMKSYLIRYGFREFSRIEIQKQFSRLRLVAPRKREGKETGFVFSANGLSVVIWTTFLIEEGKAREVDAAWVLVVKGDEVPYFSHPIHRTENFIKNLINQAWIARWRVLHRPLCQKCKEFMEIARGRGLGARYWSCVRLRHHDDGKPFFLDWDYELPPRAKQFVVKRRERRATYVAKRREEGKPVLVARLRRKRWTSKLV